MTSGSNAQTAQPPPATRGAAAAPLGPSRIGARQRLCPCSLGYRDDSRPSRPFRQRQQAPSRPLAPFRGVLGELDSNVTTLAIAWEPPESFGTPIINYEVYVDGSPIDAGILRPSFCGYASDNERCKRARHVPHALADCRAHSSVLMRVHTDVHPPAHTHACTPARTLKMVQHHRTDTFMSPWRALSRLAEPAMARHA